MQYVMLVDVPDQYFDGDDSIEVAASIVNTMITDSIQFAVFNFAGEGEILWPEARPLSEVLAC